MKVVWDYLSEADKLYLLSHIPSWMLYEELDRRAHQLPEEEEEENEEEEFEFQSLDEWAYAHPPLYSRYPNEIVHLIFRGKLKVPLWLQKEILGRRKEGRAVFHKVS